MSAIYNPSVVAAPFDSCGGFDWDRGNLDKNWKLHGVPFWECEQVFFNEPLLVVEDVSHSGVEKRYYALGRTDAGRRLFVVFTIRRNLVRVISARDMSRRERKRYEQEKKENPGISH
jgi:uncharacterized DUF497 family protein